MITKRAIPHGKVAVDGIKDPSTRAALMRLNENISSLAAQLSDLQGACQLIERDLNGALSKITAIQDAP